MAMRKIEDGRPETEEGEPEKEKLSRFSEQAV